MKSITTLLILLAAACSSGGSSFSSDADATYEDFADVTMVAPREDVELEEPREAVLQKSKPNEGVEVQQKLIKTGSMSYRVEEANTEYASVGQMLGKYSAYIASESQQKQYDRKSFHLSIKVPPEYFDSLMAAIAVRHSVEQRSTNVQDVTNQYYDLKSRIKNKRKLEARYQEVLKKAESVRDILEVERNLNIVRTEIESMQGQLKLLSFRVSYSTLELHFYELLPYQNAEDPRPGFGRRLRKSLSWGWQGFLSAIVFVLRLWPFVILATMTILLIRKRQKKKNA